MECAKEPSNPEAIRELVRDGVDYRALLRQAGVHGLSPLVYWRLNESCAEAVPEAPLQSLREAFRASARRVLLLTAELFRLLEAFREAGVPVVPLKGPALAWTAYPNPALRPFGDLDLFVRREDVLPARKVLIGAGYGDSLEESQIGRGFLRWNEELPFRRRRRPVVDLHWSAGPEHFPLSSFDDAWERLSPVEIDGRAVPAFCPEDRLRFACIHGTKHAWPSLLWLSDVARLASLDLLDWDRFLADCEAGLCAARCSWGFCWRGICWMHRSRQPHWIKSWRQAGLTGSRGSNFCRRLRGKAGFASCGFSRGCWMGGRPGPGCGGA